MTAQEKADELIDKMYYVGRYDDKEDYNPAMAWERAKQCALIAVDEIVKFMEMDDEYNDCLYFANSKWVQYLIEVKQEIEKL
jgi:hypothetical protein